MITDRKKARASFADYLKDFDLTDEKIRLKVVHTEGVIQCADEITEKMGLNAQQRDLAFLIALLHDIGRFEQVKRFHSFERSTMDHASYGTMLLFGEEKMIRRFTDDPSMDPVIFEAIARHSDYSVKHYDDPEMDLQVRLIRDADKLDNCRVKLEEDVAVLLGVEAEAAGKQKISDRIWEMCMQRQSVRSEMRCTKMDYWVSYLAYFYDINFKETFQIIESRDYVNRIADRIPVTDPETLERMAVLKAQLNEMVREKGGR